MRLKASLSRHISALAAKSARNLSLVSAETTACSCGPSRLRFAAPSRVQGSVATSEEFNLSPVRRLSSRREPGSSVDPHGRSKFSLESNATGTFLVAREAIPSGTLVMTDPGTIESAPNMHTIQYDEQTHINCPGPIRFCNHSCAPNCTMQVSKDPPGASLVAIRAIAEGEAFSFDYATTEWDMSSPFACSCGAAACRGRISGYSALTAAQRGELHAGSVSPYILSRSRKSST